MSRVHAGSDPLRAPVNKLMCVDCMQAILANGSPGINRQSADCLFRKDARQIHAARALHQ
jgi:hypothetical protein